MRSSFLVLAALAAAPLAVTHALAFDPAWQSEVGPDRAAYTLYNGTSSFQSAVDPLGDIVIGGSGVISGYSDYAWIEKLAADGTSLWYNEWATSAPATVRLTSVLVGGDGDVYVQVSVRGSATADVVVLALDGDSGELRWTRTIESSTVDFGLWPNDFRFDSLGRLISSCVFYDAESRMHQRRSALTTAGQAVWSALESARYRGAFLRPGPCAASSAGTIVCVNAGLHTNLKPNTPAHLDIMVTRYDATGRAVWSKVFDDQGVDNIAADVALDADGNVLVVGWNAPSTGAHSLLSMRVRMSNGQKMWQQRVTLESRFTNTSLLNGTSSNVALVPTTGGDFIAVAREYGTSSKNLFVRLRTATGAVAWVTRIPGWIANSRPAVTPTGDPVVLAYVDTTAEHDLLRVIDGATGALAAEQVTTIGWGASVAIDDATGRIYAIGATQESVDGVTHFHGQCAAYD